MKNEQQLELGIQSSNKAGYSMIYGCQKSGMGS